MDAELAIRGGCRAKIHAGPGMVTRNGQSDKEIKFVFDLDLYMAGNVAVNLSAGALQTLQRSLLYIDVSIRKSGCRIFWLFP